MATYNSITDAVSGNQVRYHDIVTTDTSPTLAWSMALEPNASVHVGIRVIVTAQPEGTRTCLARDFVVYRNGYSNAEILGNILVPYPVFKQPGEYVGDVDIVVLGNSVYLYVIAEEDYAQNLKWIIEISALRTR